MVHPIILTALALLAGVWSFPSHAIVAEITDFAVSRNGHVIFDDGFDDGAAPPSAPPFSGGKPASYSVFGSFPAGSESGGSLQLDSANGALSANAHGDARRVLHAMLLTAPSADGLGIDDVLWMQGVFALTTPVGPFANGYAVEFTDASAGQQHQHAELQVAFAPAYGEAQIRYQLQDFDAGSITLLDSVAFLPPPDADQIVLRIARPDAGSNDFYASYEFLSEGSSIGGGSFATPAALFDGEDYVRARFKSFTAVVPEPSTPGLFAAGLCMLVLVGATRRIR